MSMSEFDAITEASLVAKGGRKWSTFPGSIGAFIAEMDFGVAPAVRQALREIDERDLFGYAPYDLTADLKSATANFYADRFGWRIPVDHIQPASDVIAEDLGDVNARRQPVTPRDLPSAAVMPFILVPISTGR